jgi:hypothetical protein
VAAAADVLVAASGDGTVRAYDAEGCGAAECPALWTRTVGPTVSGPAIVSNARVLVPAGQEVVAYGLG